MITNQIDKFRNDFFEMVVKQEKEKEAAQKLLQSQCFHLYDIIVNTYSQGTKVYQERMCSKCQHSDVRSITVWEGTKRGQCIIS